VVDARAFEAIARDAETLLGASDLDAEATRALVARAREATDAVPAARRDDWRTLLGGFDRDEPAERRLARLEGLIRACTAFRALAPGAPKPKPLCAEDSVAALAGLGPSTAKVLAEQGVRDVGDLVLSPPMAAIDLRAPASGEAVLAAALAPERRAIAVRGVVEKVSIVPMRGRRAIRVALRSGDVLVELWWFFMAAGARALSGEIVAIGTPSLSAGSSRKQGTVRIAHPRIVKAGGDDRIEPIYPFRGLPNAKVAQAIRDALGRLPLADLEPLPPALLGDAAPLASLLHDVHTPDAMEAHLAARDAVRARLATAEACWLVSRRLERERALSALRAPNLAVDPRGRAALVRAFGFTPTRAQERAIDAIGARLASDAPSRTLLTGDVGTGKTAVLLAAAAQAIAARSQVAIFAPTTLLADQYVEAAGPLARALKARVVLLPRASADRAGFQRVVALARAGEVDVVVGTHALLADEVSFSRLGLVVVDEQHRLGVAQRLGVVERGRAASASGEEALAPHLITVSATPIPRTLALALRGEIESVHLDERPRGRRTPATALLPRPRFGEALERIRAALAEGGRAYVVCANIDARTLDDGTPDALASPGAKARAAELAKALGDDVVALVHGAMDDDARRRALTAFRRGEARVLVGTSLLEVGIDVPEATLMVVDGADRFGLAQLHQLRGRVGRGERLGTCLLVHPEPLADVSRARLVALVEAREGLEVAKADLRLRGPGDLEGARQSGEASGFRFLDPLADEARIGAAYEAMRALLEENPTLEGPTLQGFRRVLARFDAIAATGDLGLAMGEAG
jgi:ATP-dependent DNA helicase RecG